MQAPCAVEIDTARWMAQQDADDRENAREAAAIDEATSDLKAEILAAIRTGTMATKVSCASSHGDPITMTLDEAVFEALASEKAQSLMLALLRSDAGKAVAEFIAGEHARTYGDALGIANAGAQL